MDDTCVFLVGLDGFFGDGIPDVDEFIIAWDDIGGGRRELTIPDPVVVAF